MYAIFPITINNSCFLKNSKENKENKNDQVDLLRTTKNSENLQFCEALENELLSIKDKSAPIACPDCFIDEFTCNLSYIQSQVKANGVGFKWSTLAEVINSRATEKMNKQEVILQEAMFEVISSEARYFFGLQIAVDYFSKSFLFTSINDNNCYVNPIDKYLVFSNISSIMEISNRLLNDMEKRWERDKPLLKDICDILHQHASSDSFNHYIIYVSNHTYQIEALQKLMKSNLFKTELQNLESCKDCKNLPLSSYLLLPFQRLTRLKLLCENILKILQHEEINKQIYSDQIQSAKMAISQFEVLLTLSQKEYISMDCSLLLDDLVGKFDFPKDCEEIELSKMKLLREGEFEIDSFKKKIFHRSNKSLILLLFDTRIMIGKRNGSRIQILNYSLKTDVIFTKQRYFQFIKSFVNSKSNQKETFKTVKISIKFKNGCNKDSNGDITVLIPENIIDEWIHALKLNSK